MGPGATADVLAKIVQVTPARRDQEHIPIVVRCIPQIPDRTEALLGIGPSPAQALAAGAMALRESGADFLAIACNTAHHWYDVVRGACALPVVHIADAVLHELRAVDCRDARVGLLATRGTLQSGFYCQRLETQGYSVLLPSEDVQSRNVDAGIAATKTGDLEAARALVQSAVDSLRRRGASHIVLACTELPLALGHEATLADAGLIDANRALARACVREAMERAPSGSAKRADEARDDSASAGQTTASPHGAATSLARSRIAAAAAAIDQWSSASPITTSTKVAPGIVLG
jgi:aspartate racemase